jgi:NADPH-dependent 2,4-dienoyl-CoA reductase/sulfur reductase-like enzyme
MERYRYLIVGGGMAAHAAVHAIRDVDPDGRIGMFTAEPTGPYKRPPLSKGLWKDDDPETIWLGVHLAGLELHLGRRVVAIDRAQRTVQDDRGANHGYEKLLLATGGAPRRLPFGGDDVIYFRTLGDYELLRSRARAGARVAVIGGGFIGSEVAASLAPNGVKVTLLFPEPTVCARLLPPDLGAFVDDLFRQHGVRLLPRTSVVGILTSGGSTVVETSTGERIPVDAVVAGVGIRPSVELAEAAGLTVDDGIVVDAALRTSDPAIFAAGDVARFFNPALGAPIRVEHEDGAVTMGGAAGRSMAGLPVAYDHLPFFYSDLFDLGYEAVGITDARLEVVADWIVPNRQGFLYYLDRGRVRGVVCWGVFGRLPEARAVIAEGGPLSAPDLRGRIRPPA